MLLSKGPTFSSPSSEVTSAESPRRSRTALAYCWRVSRRSGVTPTDASPQAGTPSSVPSSTPSVSPPVESPSVPVAGVGPSPPLQPAARPISTSAGIHGLFAIFIQFPQDPALGRLHEVTVRDDGILHEKDRGSRRDPEPGTHRGARWAKNDDWGRPPGEPTAMASERVGLLYARNRTSPATSVAAMDASRIAAGSRVRRSSRKHVRSAW